MHRVGDLVRRRALERSPEPVAQRDTPLAGELVERVAVAAKYVRMQCVEACREIHAVVWTAASLTAIRMLPFEPQAPAARRC
jgi:hypothetical protein